MRLANGSDDARAATRRPAVAAQPRAAARRRLAAGLAAAWLAAAGVVAGEAAAQLRAAGVREAETTEIAPFRLISVEGYVEGRYWRDLDDSTVLSGPVGSGDTQRTQQTLTSLGGTVFLMTHSYVYHPNFLLLDLGAGPVGFRNGYTYNGLETQNTTTTYDLAGRATFLRNKPYNGALFYDRKTDSYPVGPSQSLLTENTKYGFEFALLRPVIRAPVHVDAYRFHSKGRGTDQIIDESIDEANVRAEYAWGKAGDTSFRYQAVQNDSQSGSVGLPIQATRSRTNRADLDTYLSFGDRGQYDLTNTVSYSAIDYTSNAATIADNQTFRFDVNFRARPTDALQTRARYQFDSYDQQAGTGPQSGRLNAVNAGATYQPAERFSATLDALASASRSTALDADLIGLNGSLNGWQGIGFGEIAANYGVNWFKRDQTANEPFGQVVGERHVLPGLAWVPLNRPQVVPGSVVVSNVQRTQTYAEGRDYLLRVIGLVTQIQRTIEGAIVDGQEVLVDYSYDTGGTYGLTEFDNAIDLTWRLKQYFSIYARYTDTSPRLNYGAPTAPLNPATTTLYGSRADLPFELLGYNMQLGGLAEWEDRREVISPYRRTLYEAYFETSLPLIARGALRVGGLKQATEYDLTPEDNVTTRTVTLRLWTAFRIGLRLEAQGTRTRDTGSPQVEREYWQATLKAIWRIRQVLLTLDGGRTKEFRGAVERTHSTGRLTLRRDF